LIGDEQMTTFFSNRTLSPHFQNRTTLFKNIYHLYDQKSIDQSINQMQRYLEAAAFFIC
jgi:hypothetical protein